MILKTLKLTAVGLILGFSGSLVLSARTLAHETDQPHVEAQASKGSDEAGSDYVFVTPRGGSLTLLTRRSLQLYDKATSSIKLTEAGTVYAETNIVKSLGARFLEIGERVKISGDLVSKFAKKSLNLTSQQESAWQFYANRANFNLEDLRPVSGIPTEPKTKKPQDQTKDQTETPKNQDQAKKASKSNWQSWLIGISVLAILYYLLRRQ